MPPVENGEKWRRANGRQARSFDSRRRTRSCKNPSAELDAAAAGAPAARPSVPVGMAVRALAFSLSRLEARATIAADARHRAKLQLRHWRLRAPAPQHCPRYGGALLAHAPVTSSPIRSLPPLPSALYHFRGFLFVFCTHSSVALHHALRERAAAAGIRTPDR